MSEHDDNFERVWQDSKPLEEPETKTSEAEIESDAKTTRPELPSNKPDIPKICKERAGTMIADGFAWCDCGIEPVRRSMGHRRCQYC